MPLAALIAGGIFAFGLAPFDIWVLSIVSAAALFWLLEVRSGVSSDGGKRSNAFFIGWLYGVGKYGVGVSWIYVSIHEHGHAAPALAAFLVAVFVAGMALFHGAAAVLFVKLKWRNSVFNAVWFTTIWILLEWLLTWFLTGFPWLFVGYAMIDTPLAAYAPVGGVFLVGFVAVLTGCLLACARTSRWIALVAAGSAWLGTWALADVRWTAPAAEHTVALVQGDISQQIKWRGESRQQILDTYVELSEPVWDRDIVIWPEAAITLYHHQAKAFLDEMARRLSGTSGTLVLGIPVARRTPEGWLFFNAAVSVGAGTGRYLKQRLVPFGEYVPFDSMLRGMIEFFDMPMSTLERGPPGQPLLTAGDLALAMLICYEIAYPQIVLEQARQADVLVTISNDTWFGGSIGPIQHLQMARMRALEAGRYLLRSTNDGITAIVDDQGEIVNSLAQFEPGVLTGTFRSMSGLTPYLRAGNVPTIATLLTLLGLLLVVRFTRFVVRFTQ
ncbi:MAG: apolipoprotein N-acyltransferase [Gammaproteobacteria bacterium]|nr:apolipoprotein N-acyltransferase [Gammaproteobacteria bacterium]